MLLNTDPGVIEQYERRKEEVCLLMIFDCPGCPGRAQRSLTKKIEDRERAAAKVEKSMKVARVRSIDTIRGGELAINGNYRLVSG
jgi:predicted metal-binding protein